MAEEYILHRDQLNRFLLQHTDTGLFGGLLFPAAAGESARAFSYDFGSVWYPNQIVNLSDFPELAEMPFFTIESYDLDRYFREPKCEVIIPILGAYGKYLGYSLNCPQFEAFDPPLWNYQFPNPNGSWRMPIFDIWVNEQGCFSCNREGWIIGVNHQGEPIQQYQLSKLTRNLFADAETLYVSCDDGHIYELTGKVPEALYRVAPTTGYYYIYSLLNFSKTKDNWIVADIYGKLTATDLNWQMQWQKDRSKFWLSFMLCADQNYIYQGYYDGLVCLDQKTGENVWDRATSTPVLCGSLLDQTLFFACGDRHLYRLSTDGSKDEISIFQTTGIPYALTIAEDGQHIFISDYDRHIYLIDTAGNLHKTFTLEIGAAMAMKQWGDRLYVVTSQGTITCLQLDPQTIYSSEPTKGVKLHCIKVGNKLKIRPLSDTYRQDWNVHFPQHLRQEGAIYMVEDLKIAKEGGFYRVVGKIQPQKF